MGIVYSSIKLDGSMNLALCMRGAAATSGSPSVQTSSSGKVFGVVMLDIYSPEHRLGH